ncbi:MAG: sugar ABC transporter substrate-binding protein [Propionibacteriaceae bacterium]|nr:sugar ABC transporter substrate-binding protein [Propionibacteriaceae bacterium]
MRPTRRDLFSLAALAAAPAALSGCGFTKQAPAPQDSAGGAQNLTFTTWGTDNELAALRKTIERFEAANDGMTVKLNAVPYEQMFTNIDAQLQSNTAPDIFRVPYYTFGSYAGQGQLLDLKPHLSDGFSDRFTPQAWAAVQNEKTPFGVPHHTDTSAILYNKDMFDAAGITSVPTSLEDAWTWEELEQVALQLRESLPASKYPMAYNWQGNGVTRWLSWLFQADGRFLEEDLKTPAIDSDAGRAAVEFTSSFFSRDLVPQNDSVKSTTYASDIWYSETVAMTWAGAFLIPDAAQTLKFNWGATFAPRNVRAGSDFGGNALVATAGTKVPELATSFLEFITEEESMRDFCEAASLLPTRADLVESGITFADRPELSDVFIKQASAVQASDSSQVASPNMSAIITVLKDQLEQAFVGGQSVDDTIAGLSEGIAKATGG